MLINVFFSSDYKFPFILRSFYVFDRALGRVLSKRGVM